MKSIDKIIVILIICSIIFGAMPVSGYAKEKKVSNLPGSDTYAPGEVIFKLKSGTSAAEISKIISKYNAKTAKQILKDNKKRDKLAEKSLKKFGIERIYILEVSESSDINKLVDKLNKNPDMEYAEPNYVVHIDTNPNDTFFSNLWGLHNTGQTGGTVDADIDAPEAWEIQTGSSDVVIAVIDSGVDYLHPDLAGNIWTNPGETPDDGLDNDNNGYTDDVHGYDFVSNDGAPLDGYGHGTHVAGTIGAVGNNDLGIVGVNWNVAIMPIRFLGDTGSGTTSNAVSSIIYAIDNGADILSNSWGGGSYSSAMKDTISAANDAGILFVAAAGNAGSNNDESPHYPSSYYVPNVVAVAATDNNDGKPSFSNYGLKSVDLGAPGAVIYSTVPTEGGSLSDPSGYKNLSGTSMATPHVAGVAGLIKAQFPQYSSDEIKARLLESVDNIPSLNGITVTGGRLNAKKSLTIAPLSVLFYDDMETAGGWTHSGSGDNWESGTPLSGPGSAKSGTNVWATKLNGDYATNNMDARLTSPSIDLSTVSSANLTFYHHYDIESTTDGSIGYDGGILEASNNGGISWTRITPVGGYLTDISTQYNNPLGSESAYSHYSGAGWHYAMFDMSNYAGSSDVKIQFRFATDSSINNYPGWYIDDVTVLGELIEPNIAPVALDDNYDVNEDNTLDVFAATGVLANDNDADNDTLRAVLFTGPSHGALALNPDGSFAYTSVTDFNGADSFTYKAKDSKNAESSPATVTIIVNRVNDAPVAQNDSYSVNKDTSLDVPAAGVLSNDNDVDGEALSAVLVAGPSNGTLILNSNGSFTYTPVTDFNGPDSFTYHANDGIVNSNNATVKILVNAINSVSVAMLFYDDIETAGGWTHSGSGDNWESGTPLSGPGSAKSGTNVWATKLNGDYATNNMDARLTSPSIDLSTVSSANLTFYHHYDMESTTDGSIGYDGGILEASNNGGISWTRITPIGGYPSDISTGYSNPLGGESAYSHYSGAGWHYAMFDMSNYAGSSDVNIQFRFATDSSINNYPGWYIDDVTVLGELTEPNVAPVALDDIYNVNEDTTLAPAIGVLDNDTDADDDVLSAVLVAVPSNGTLTLNSNGSFTYIPAANFNGADSFTYKAKDSKNAESSPATVTITINPINDIPVALDDSYGINEGASLDVPATGVLGNDNDVDGDVLSAVLVAGPSNGTLTLNSNGSFTYTQVIDFNGPDSFTYKAKDSNNAESSPATVTITAQSAEVVEFFDSFEYGYSNWVQDSQNDWRIYTQRSTNGTYSAEVDGWARDAKLTMANGIDLSGKTDAILSFSWFIENNWDNGEYIKLEISTDGITWTELASIDGNGNSENQWVHEEIDLSEYMTENVKIQFKARVSSSREDGNIDNVRIVSMA